MKQKRKETNCPICEGRLTVLVEGEKIHLGCFEQDMGIKTIRYLIVENQKLGRIKKILEESSQYY